MSNEERLIIYGGAASQPTRAVWWACLMKGLPFEMRQSKSREDFLRLNPRAQIPTVVDGDFVLYEMPAILAYLCDKHGWEDLYPSDPKTRALINQYLHFHHSATRLATFKLMGPHVTSAFGGIRGTSVDYLMRETITALVDSPNKLEEGRKVLAVVSGIIESGYFRSGTPYLCGTEGPTIADIACYEELAQLKWANLFEYAGFPKIQRFFEEMATLPYHDVVHAYNLALGDINTDPNTMERFVHANTAGAEALQALGIPSTSD